MSTLKKSSRSLTRQEAQTVIEYARKCCKRWGVKLVFDHKNRQLDLDETVGSEAYFSHDPEPLIKVSTAGRSYVEWIPDLLHELSHGLQWFTQSTVWKNSFIDYVPVETLANLWVNHKIELNPNQLTAVFAAISAVELNAEIKTVELIKHFKLDSYIDTKLYAKKAWAYILSYRYTKMYRAWMTEPPYHNPEIVYAMPESLDEQPSFFQFTFLAEKTNS